MIVNSCRGTKCQIIVEGLTNIYGKNTVEGLTQNNYLAQLL